MKIRLLSIEEGVMQRKADAITGRTITNVNDPSQTLVEDVRTFYEDNVQGKIGDSVRHSA